MPSRNFTPSITFASHWKPRNRRQFFSALMPSLKIIASIPSRVRHPLVRSVRCLMVAKVDSIGLCVADVTPVLGGKVVEGEQRLAILHQAFDRLGILGLEGGDELLEG